MLALSYNMIVGSSRFPEQASGRLLVALGTHRLRCGHRLDNLALRAGDRVESDPSLWADRSGACQCLFQFSFLTFDREHRRSDRHPDFSTLRKEQSNGLVGHHHHITVGRTNFSTEVGREADRYALNRGE